MEIRRSITVDRKRVSQRNTKGLKVVRAAVGSLSDAVTNNFLGASGPGSEELIIDVYITVICR